MTLLEFPAQCVRHSLRKVTQLGQFISSHPGGLMRVKKNTRFSTIIKQFKIVTCF